MKKSMILLTLFATFATAQQLQAQIKTPQPSPVQTVKQEIGLAEVEYSYSRPSAKGRTIFGDLVPYGKMWRTGANASSKIKFNDDLSFNGTKVPKGEYAIYTIPMANEWTVILYKDVTCWGVCEEYKTENEAARFTVKSNTVPYTETFTISLDNLTNSSAVLKMAWEKTGIEVKLENDVDSRVMASIQSFMDPKPDYRPYYNAASYYFETNKDMNEALKFVNKAYEISPKFWVSHLKAKIQYALKDYKGAIVTAELSKTSAAAEKNDDYVQLNEKLIAKAKAAN